MEDIRDFVPPLISLDKLVLVDPEKREPIPYGDVGSAGLNDGVWEVQLEFRSDVDGAVFTMGNYCGLHMRIRRKGNWTIPRQGWVSNHVNLCILLLAMREAKIHQKFFMLSANDSNLRAATFALFSVLMQWAREGILGFLVEGHEDEYPYPG